MTNQCRLTQCVTWHTDDQSMQTYTVCHITHRRPINADLHSVSHNTDDQSMQTYTVCHMTHRRPINADLHRVSHDTQTTNQCRLTQNVEGVTAVRAEPCDGHMTLDRLAVLICGGVEFGAVLDSKEQVIQVIRVLLAGQLLTGGAVPELWDAVTGVLHLTTQLHSAPLRHFSRRRRTLCLVCSKKTKQTTDYNSRKSERFKHEIVMMDLRLIKKPGAPFHIVYYCSQNHRGEKVH